MTNDMIPPPQLPAPALVPLHGSVLHLQGQGDGGAVWLEKQSFDLGGGEAGALVGAGSPGLAVLTLHTEWAISHQRRIPV